MLDDWNGLFLGYGTGNLNGIPIILNEMIKTPVWIFPKHRFFEWESKDEAVCRKLGIGHEEMRPGALLIGGRIYMHPDLQKALPKK